MSGKVPSLEDELERRAGKCSVSKTLHNSYSLMKERLKTTYYPWIQSRLPYYTDHGERHVDAVIHAASHLLGYRLLRDAQTFSPLDIFLVLSAIIWHDAGMVLERSNHEQTVVALMEEVRALAFPSVSVFRLLKDIVRAHTGPTGLSIPDVEYTCTLAPAATFHVYPRALAAIVRFADEISENQTRISPGILGLVPPPQQIYWNYAASISSSIPDPGRQRVVIDFEFPANAILSRFQCREFAGRCDGAKTITLLEYALCRLEKVNTERAYCGREFARYADIRQVAVRFSVMRDLDRVDGYDNLEIVLSDAGLNIDSYPRIQFFEQFFDQHTTWTPAGIEKALTV